MMSTRYVAFWPMKRWASARSCALALLLVWVAGCGGGSSPTQPGDGSNPPPFQVTSGTFDVTATKGYDTCASTTTYGGAYDVVINGDSLSIGDQWTGTWDAQHEQGVVESVRDRYTTPRGGCTVTTWTSVTVTFSSSDQFSGAITFRQRVDGDCRPECITTWTIQGVRQSGGS